MKMKMKMKTGVEAAWCSAGVVLCGAVRVWCDVVWCGLGVRGG